MKKHIFAICISISSIAVMADAGKDKSAVCAACHGADGNSTNTLWPKLAGQHENYIVQQLKNFQSGDRQDPSMSPQAANLSEQDMLDLAAYFASQTINGGSAFKDSLMLGQKIYRGGNKETGVAACIACHGPTGKGNPAAKYPTISGQHAAYTLKQLQDYKSGKRKATDKAEIMRDIAIRMSEAEMQAVTNYIQGLY
jgi:cytochrome c553